MTSKDTLSISALLLIALGLTLPVLVGDKAYLPRHSEAQDFPWTAHGTPSNEFNHLASDKVNLIYPDVVFAADQLSRGHFPSWNPDILCGVPHLANPLTGTLYPPNLILFRLDPLDALLASAGLHALLAAVFFYGFLRVSGLRSAASLLGAIALGASGWVTAHLHSTPLLAVFSWVPLGLMSLEARFRGGGVWTWRLLALSVAMMWLAGFPQLAVLGTLTLALYGLLGLIATVRGPGAGRFGRELLGGIVFLALGLCLASPQLLSTFELMDVAGHQDRTAEDLVSERFRPAGFLGLLLPGFLGHPTDARAVTDHWGAKVVLGEGSDGVVPAAMNWIERTLYPGVAVLLLALLGLCRGPSRTWTTLAVLGLIGVLLASQEFAIRAISGVAGFNVGAPARAIVMVAWVVPALAARGFQDLLDGTSARAPKLLFALALLGFLTFGTATAVTHVGPDWSLERLIEYLKWTGVEDRFGVRPHRAVADYIPAFAPAFADLTGDLLRATVVFGSVLCLLTLRRAAVRRPAPWALAWILVVAADLVSFLLPPNGSVPKKALFGPTPGIAYLKKHLGDERLLRVSDTAEHVVTESSSLLVPNLGLVHGLRDVQGWREQIPKHTLTLWKGVAVQKPGVGLGGIPVDQVSSPLLRLARVRFLVAKSDLASLEAWRVFPPPTNNDPGLRIYEIQQERRLPRAWVVHEARVLPDEDAVREIQQGRIDPAKVVVLPKADGIFPEVFEPSSSTRVEIRAETPQGIVMHIDASNDGYLVMPDSWAPGWSCTIRDERGSRSTDVLRAMVAFRAVRVTKGPQIVELRYRPLGLRLSVPIAVTAGLGLVFLPWAPVFRRRRRLENPVA